MISKPSPKMPEKRQFDFQSAVKQAVPLRKAITASSFEFKCFNDVFCCLALLFKYSYIIIQSTI